MQMKDREYVEGTDPRIYIGHRICRRKDGTLTGVPDEIIRCSRGGFVIMDYKTSRQKTERRQKRSGPGTTTWIVGKDHGATGDQRGDGLFNADASQ